MCLPQAALLIGATVASVAGTAFSAIQASAQSNYQAKVADRNAKMESEAAFQAQQATRQDALAHYRRVAQLKGEQQAAFAANGIDTNFGTTGEIKADTQMLANEDVANIYDQGGQRVRGFDINSANFRGEANAQRSAATGALISGALDIGSTVLSSASQYGKLKSPKPAVAAPNYNTMRSSFRTLR